MFVKKSEKNDPIVYPIIANKYLALKKICSRKESDRLLRAGKIKINGRIAEPGQMVYSGDKVEAENEKALVYLAYNKPKGIITHSPQAGERSIEDIVKFREKVFPVGRLDKASSGLIILTNDGRVTDKLLNPDFYHEKQYEVRVSKPFGAGFLEKMRSGVKLDDGYVTRECPLKKISADSFVITLTEGKKHQIRRMCEALGFKVINLRRVRIMNIRLGVLRQGEYREISGAEKDLFLASLGL